MKREFIENRQVKETYAENGVTDEQVRDMEKEIMQGLGKTVPGTAGIRKIRCGAQGRGKRGGVRVLFADYPEAGKAYLLAALSKNEKADFTKEEQAILRDLKLQLDEYHR